MIEVDCEYLFHRMSIYISFQKLQVGEQNKYLFNWMYKGNLGNLLINPSMMHRIISGLYPH